MVIFISEVSSQSLIKSLSDPLAISGVVHEKSLGQSLLSSFREELQLNTSGRFIHHWSMIADEDDKFHDEEILYFGPSPSNQINTQTDEPNKFMDDLLQSMDNLEAMKRTYMYLMDFHTA